LEAPQRLIFIITNSYYKSNIQTTGALDNQGRATLNIGAFSGGVYVVKVSIGDKSFTGRQYQ
jgi:hypothetical protein